MIPEGETIPIETEIAVIADGTTTPEVESATAPAPETAPPVQVRPVEALNRRYSPFVRKLAQEHQVDLSGILGTGAGGRVTKDDVLRSIGQPQPASMPEVATERVRMSRMRKLIAEHMIHSRRTAADVTTFFEIDMTEVARQRERAKDRYQSQNGIKLTFLPFVVAAVVKALQAYPVLNSSIEGEDMVFHKGIHVGIAVALDDGLIVPVLRSAEERNLLGIARGIQDLSDRARSRKLSPDELQGGTFTITNPGVFGALMGTPIIHQPQVAILGVGAVVKRAVVINDAIAIRSMSYFSLSYDHRALDGATADRFLAHVRQTLEQDCPSPDVQ